MEKLDFDYIERYIKIIEKTIISDFICKSEKKLNLYKFIS